MKVAVVSITATAVWLAAGSIAARPALADGCYICRSGSSCGEYCRYAGRDTARTRGRCRAKGCKIAGTASCPSSTKAKVCRAGPRRDRDVLAAVVQPRTSVR